MEPNENNQFSAACAVAYAAMNDDDKSRMEKSTKMLKALSAMMAGIPVDLEALMGDMDPASVFPLQMMWTTA